MTNILFCNIRVRSSGLGKGKQIADIRTESIIAFFQESASVGTGDTVITKGIGLDHSLFAAFEKERSKTGVAFVDIDKFRVTFLDLHFIAETTGSIGLHGVENHGSGAVQLPDGEGCGRSIRHGAINGSLATLAGRGRQNDRRQDKYPRAFHILRVLILLSLPFSRGSPPDASCGNRGPPRSEAAQD